MCVISLINHKKIVLLKYASITVRNGAKMTLWRRKEHYQDKTMQLLTELGATWKSSGVGLNFLLNMKNISGFINRVFVTIWRNKSFHHRIGLFACSMLRMYL